MPSTPWHHARSRRASLLLAALALVLAAPLGAAHVACAHGHGDAGPPGGHSCPVCRHLADGAPVLAAVATTAAPPVVTLLVSLPGDRTLAMDAATARGRAPPAHLPVS